MSSRPLVIIGAGGFARETVELVHALNAATPTWDLIGILDDSPAMAGAQVAGLPVLGTTAAIADLADASFVVCIGNPGNYVARAQVVERLALPPERYATLCHPRAVVASTASLGPGTVVHALVVMTTDVTVGAHVAVMPSVVLTHDVEIADYATFGAGVMVAGATKIRTGAYVGSGAVLREGVTIGEWSLVGAASTVLADVPAGEVWAGSPARRLRDVTRVGDLEARLA